MELKKALSPVAQFIVDDKIAEFGESSAFPGSGASFCEGNRRGDFGRRKEDKFELGILEVSMAKALTNSRPFKVACRSSSECG
jgi:hypothetical protein